MSAKTNQKTGQKRVANAKKIVHVAVRRSQQAEDENAAKGAWKQQCATLKAERDALMAENAQLRSECAEYRRAVLKLMKEDVDFDRTELLKLAGRRPTLQEFVHGLDK